MATDFSEKERAFIDGLKPETGLDLTAWMAAIAASGCAHRNDVIDWLRQQGFTFAHASWLERIHHNGGKLIYGAVTSKLAVPLKSPTPRPAKASKPRPDDAQIDALLAAAKAYRPLAQLVLREVLAAVPGADATPVAGFVVVGHGHPFAAVQPGPRDVRLMLALGHAPLSGWEKPKFSAPTLESVAGFTHMKIMSDAREVDAGLRELILTSARNCRE